MSSRDNSKTAVVSHSNYVYRQKKAPVKGASLNKEKLAITYQKPINSLPYKDI